MANFIQDLIHTDTGEANPPGMQTIKITALVDVSGDGVVVTKFSKQDQDHLIPWMADSRMQASKGHFNIPDSAHFFVDTVGYVLGVGTDDEETDKALKKKTAFITQLKIAADAVPSAADFCAKLAAYLEDPEYNKELITALIQKKVKLIDKICFCIDGNQMEFFDSEDFQEWWLELYRTLQKGSDGDQMISVVSGDLVTPSLVHPVKIKLGKSANISAFKPPSFNHYGLSQGLNAAMSEDEAACAADALNTILADPQRTLRVKDLCLIINCDDIPTDDLMEMFGAQDFKTDANKYLTDYLMVLKQSRIKSRKGGLRGTFLAGILSANGTRVELKHWERGPSPIFVDRVTKWNEALYLGFNPVDPTKREKLWSPPYLLALLYGGYNGFSTKLLEDLYQAILSDNRGIPISLAYKAQQKFVSYYHEEGKPHWASVKMLKAFLTYGGSTMQEKINGNSTAYLCGRLLWQLSQMYRQANKPFQSEGKVSERRSLVSQKLSLCVRNPAQAFTQLLRKNIEVHHERTKRASTPVRAAGYRINQKITEIVRQLPTELPSRFSVDEKAQFMLGLYNEQGADFEAMKAHRKNLNSEGGN
jgi:hypothetical protein